MPTEPRAEQIAGEGKVLSTASDPSSARAEEGRFDSDIAASNIVGEWRQEGIVFMCPGGPVEPDACDCGFIGPWEYRAVMAWWVQPGYERSTSGDHRDTAKGWPILSRDGWWCIAGWDERCPMCGDIERFDPDGELVRRFTSLSVVTDDPEIVVSSSDLRALLTMTELLVDLTPRESVAVQRARAALLEPAPVGSVLSRATEAGQSQPLGPLRST